MRYRRYIKGNRKGQEANRIEREAMHDPFLAEALEGYDRVKDDPTPYIDIMRRRIRSRNQRRLNVFKYGGIAASLLFLLGFGLYFGLYKNNSPKDVIALQESFEQEQIEKPVATTIEDAIAQNREQKEHIKDETLPPPVLTVQSAPRHLPTEQDEVEIMTISEDMAAQASVQQQNESVATDLDEVLITTQQSRMATKANRQSQVISESEPAQGFEAYLKYIKEKMVRPTDDVCNDVKGKIKLSFLVDTSGKPYDIKVEQSLCPSIDLEAIRLIKEGPLWTPSETKVSYTIDF